MRATAISGRPVRRWLRLAPLLALAVGGAGAIGASPGSAATYLGERPVRFEPQHAAPTQQVRASGFDCGDGFGPDDLFGVELNDVAEPPTEDEGVSVVLRDIRSAADGTASGSFTIPELSPGAYHVYYLCARGEETRVFEAVPPDGAFMLDPLHPRQSAPPSERAALTYVGVPLALLLLGALLAVALWRIARASRLRAGATRAAWPIPLSEAPGPVPAGILLFRPHRAAMGRAGGRMRIYEGSPRQDWEEVLRSIGAFADRERLKELLLLELDAGFILQGLALPTAGAWAESEGVLTKATHELPDDEIGKLIDDAEAKRTPAAPTTPHAEIKNFYEQAMRVIGAYIDAQPVRDVFLFEQSGSFVLRLLMAPSATTTGHQLVEFTKEDILGMIDAAPQQRG